MHDNDLSREAMFLREIEAHPDSVAAKQIYADWLDEQGRGSDGDAMRWLAAKGVHPLVLDNWPSHGINSYSWGARQIFWGREIGHEYGFNLPFAVHSRLYGCEMFKDETSVEYHDFASAIKHLFQAWAKATAQPSWFWRLFGYKAWVPDYREPKPRELSLLERCEETRRKTESVLEETRRICFDVDARISKVRKIR